MKNSLLVLCVLLSFSAFSQREKTDFNTNNRFDINVKFLGVEFDYKHKLFNDFNLGYGIGGVHISHITLQGRGEGYWEFAKVKMFLEYDEFSDFRFHLGPKISAVYFGGTDTYAFVKAIEIGAFIRGQSAEIGIELSLADSEGFSYGSKRLTTSLLVLKIPMVRW